MDKDVFSDFIVFGEFSELKGPVSRLVLTPHSQRTDDIVINGEPFDVEAFVLRIMSVELDTNNEDWFTTMELPKHKLYACVQHISLLDLNARGYVRPIAFAYLTPHEYKFLNYYNLFQGYFSKISRLLKKINHEIFEEDLKKRLSDLLHTESEVRRAGRGQSTLPEGLSPTPSQIRECIDDLHSLYRRMHGAKNSNDDDDTGISRNQENGNTPSETPPTADGLSRKSVDESEESSNIDSGINANSSELQKLMSIVASQIPNYTPQLLKSVQRGGSYERELRTIEELTSPNWEIAVQDLKKMLLHLRRPDVVLYLETQDLTAISKPSSLLSLGGTSTLNFNYLDFSWDHTVDVSAYYEFSDTEVEPAGRPTRRSKDSHNEREKLGGTPPNNTINFPKSDAENRLNAKSADGTSSNDTTAEKLGKKRGSTDTRHRRKSRHISSTRSSDSVIVPKNDPKHFRLKSPVMSYLTGNLESCGALIWNYSLHNAGHGLFSLLKEKAWSWLPHLVFSLLKGRPVLIQADVGHKNQVVQLVQALSIFVAGPTAMAAILAQGKHSEIRSEKILEIEPCVIPWVDKPLSLATLSWLKLAGISKNLPISLSIKHYVTILDLDLATLVAPVYRDGDIVPRLLNEKKQWPNESTFLAFIHSVLYETAVNACLFYHECCLKAHLEKETGHKSSRGLSSSPSNGRNAHTKITEKTGDGRSAKYSNRAPDQSVPKNKHTHHTISNFGALRAPSEKAKLEKTTNPTIGGPGERTTKDSGSDPSPYFQAKSLSLTGVTLKQAEMEHAKHKQQHLVLQHQQRMSMNDAKTEFFKNNHIKENDAEIIEFFAEVVKRQQSLAASKSTGEPTPLRKPIPIKLDFSQTFYFEHKPRRTRRQ